MKGAFMSAERVPELHTIEDYYNTPEGARIELIHGVFYDMATPNRIHQGLVTEITVSIANHIRDKGGDCKVYPAPFSVQLSENDDTIVEPDVTVICDPKKLTDRGCLGAPDWIIEITSPSNASHDYITKLNLYMNAGVREYWIIDPETETVAVYKKDNWAPKAYTFEDAVAPGIYDDLVIDFSGIKDRI